MSVISLIRGIVKAVRPAKSGGPARFNASGREGEEFIDREMFQQFGLSSRPMEGAQCLLVRSGQNVFMIASDDRRYKIELEDGEVVMNDAFGNKIHLHMGGDITVKAGGDTGKVTIEAAGAVSVKAGKAVVDADTVLFGPEAAALSAGTVLTTTNCMCNFLAAGGTPGPHTTLPGSGRVKIV